MFFNKPGKLSLCLTASNSRRSGLQKLQRPPTYISLREDLHVHRADKLQVRDLLFGTSSLKLPSVDDDSRTLKYNSSV